MHPISFLFSAINKESSKNNVLYIDFYLSFCFQRLVKYIISMFFFGYIIYLIYFLLRKMISTLFSCKITILEFICNYNTILFMFFLFISVIFFSFLYTVISYIWYRLNFYKGEKKFSDYFMKRFIKLLKIYTYILLLIISIMLMVLLLLSINNIYLLHLDFIEISRHLIDQYLLDYIPVNLDTNLIITDNGILSMESNSDIISSSDHDNNVATNSSEDSNIDKGKKRAVDSDDSTIAESSSKKPKVTSESESSGIQNTVVGEASVNTVTTGISEVAEASDAESNESNPLYKDKGKYVVTNVSDVQYQYNDSEYNESNYSSDSEVTQAYHRVINHPDISEDQRAHYTKMLNERIEEKQEMEEIEDRHKKILKARDKIEQDIYPIEKDKELVQTKSLGGFKYKDPEYQGTWNEEYEYRHNYLERRYPNRAEEFYDRYASIDADKAIDRKIRNKQNAELYG